MSTEGGAAADALRRELRLYARHLLSCAPPPAVEKAFIDYLRSAAGSGLEPRSALDRALHALALAGPTSLFVADSFAARFRSQGSLRARIALALAFLECVPEGAERIEAPTAASRLGAWAGIVFALLAEVLSLAVGILLVPMAWGLVALSPRPGRTGPR